MPKSTKPPAEDEFGIAPVPESRRLEDMAKAAQHCRACPLWKNATQAVFGEGRKKSRLLFVGEQPGDQEDLAGRPFVGPAGKLLDRALEAAGIPRGEVYVTNTVKHFKWTPQGKRRLHAKPNSREIAACRPWLEAELAAVHPELIVCLGATAAQAVAGPSVKVTKERGKRLPTPFGIEALMTIHPSSLLRLPPSADRDEAFAQFVHDLRQAL